MTPAIRSSLIARAPLRARGGARLANANPLRQNSTATKQSLESAQKSAEKALEGAKKLGGELGNKLTGLLGGYREPVLYNLSVAREVLKQVYVREGLAPPTSTSAVTEAYSTLWSRARNPQYWNQIWTNGELAKVGVYGLEAYFIFNIGEMIGRMNLIGYDLD